MPWEYTEFDRGSRFISAMEIYKHVSKQIRCAWLCQCPLVGGSGAWSPEKLEKIDNLVRFSLNLDEICLQ